MDDLLEEMARKHGTSIDLLNELLGWEKSKVHLKKRRNKNPALRDILEKYSAEEKS